MARIEIETFYPYAIDLVWRALTSREALRQWMMESDFEAVLGHRFQFRAKPQPGWRGFVDCTVLEIEPPRRLSYSWQGDEKPNTTIVTWTLESVEGGTSLKLRHTGFEGVGGFILSKLMMGPGWKKMMTKKLPAALRNLAAGSTRKDPA